MFYACYTMYFYACYSKKMTLFVVNKEGGGYSSYSMCLTCRARAPPSQFNGYEGLGLINCLGLGLG